MTDSKFQQDGSNNYSFPDRFLWWLGTAEHELIKDCVVDRNRYRITGLIVLGTWLFATLAWTYFFSTSISTAWVYLPLGVFMGFVVLGIDRALIKGISKHNKFKAGPLLLRGMLALTIGLFMAQPAVLFLFEKEVKMQASLDNEGRRKTKRKQLDSLYAGQKTALLEQKETLEKNLDLRYADMLAAQKNYLAETDGTGGSGKIGISNIANAKKAELERLDKAYVQMEQQDQPKIDTLTSRLNQLEESIQQQEAIFAGLLNNGFLTQIEALQNLVKANNAVAYRYYLIVVILMLIELMPVIIKSLQPSGPYDEKVRLSDLAEKEEALNLANWRAALQKHFSDLGLEEDKAASEHFFKELKVKRAAAINDGLEEWEANKGRSFQSLLTMLKKRVFSRT